MAEEPKPLPKPVDWDELYPGKFLKAGDLRGQRVTVTIKSVDLYELEGEKGKKIKGVIEFEGKGKGLTLNKINGLCLRAMFGRKVQEMVGKRIVLYPDTVKEAGAMQGDPCVRIYGSPDIARDIDVNVQLPKRKPYTLTMHSVGAGSKSGPATAPRAASGAPSREPGSDG